MGRAIVLFMNLPTSLFNIPRQKSLQSKDNLAKRDLLVVAVQGSHPPMNLSCVVVQAFHLAKLRHQKQPGRSLRYSKTVKPI
jgi:hypothetical protein